MSDISNSDDLIDSRDVIARIEELESYLDTVREEQGFESEFDTWLQDTHKNAQSLIAKMGSGGADVASDIAELLNLRALASECEGYSDWEHGETLIRESHWTDYCKQLLEDIGSLPKDLPSFIEIDWDKTADNMKVDYTEVDFDGVSYLIRSC